MNGDINRIRVASSPSASNTHNWNTNEQWGPHYVIPAASIAQTACLFPLKSSLLDKPSEISCQIRSDMIRNERSVGASLYNTYVKNRSFNDKIVDAEYSSSILPQDANLKPGNTSKKRKGKNVKKLEESVAPAASTNNDPQNEYNKAVNNVNRRQKKNRKKFRLFVMVSDRLNSHRQSY